MLDGTVTSVLQGRTLVLDGDDLNNAIQISVVDGRIRIEGQDNSGPTIVTGVTSVPVASVGNVRIRMGRGDDCVGIGRLDDTAVTSVFASDFSIDLGEGNNAVGIGRAFGLGSDSGDVSIRGGVSVWAGNGSDSIELRGATLTGDLCVSLGDGRNSLLFMGPNPGQIGDPNWVTIGRNMRVCSGSGNDTIQLVGFNVGLDVDLQLGGGDNTVSAGGSPGAATNIIGRDLSVVTKSGNDWVSTVALEARRVTLLLGDSVGGEKPHDTVEIQPGSHIRELKVHCIGNAGIELLECTVAKTVDVYVRKRGQFSAGAGLRGDVSIDLGSSDSTGEYPDDDLVQIISGEIGGRLDVYTGAGADTIGIADGLYPVIVRGSVCINAGAGDDLLTIGPNSDTEGRQVLFGSIFLACMGAGNDSVAVGAPDADPWVRFADRQGSVIDGGGGANQLTDSGHTGRVYFTRFQT
jgi:hypothetical protein